MAEIGGIVQALTGSLHSRILAPIHGLLLPAMNLVPIYDLGTCHFAVHQAFEVLDRGLQTFSERYSWPPTQRLLRPADIWLPLLGVIFRKGMVKPMTISAS